MKWQPIKTAPDMGIKNVLLWNGVLVFLGWRDDDGWHDCETAHGFSEPEDPQPTHWRSLPEPPAKSADTQ